MGSQNKNVEVEEAKKAEEAVTKGANGAQEKTNWSYMQQWIGGNQQPKTTVASDKSQGEVQKNQELK
jgi:hypothetical protein